MSDGEEYEKWQTILWWTFGEKNNTIRTEKTNISSQGEKKGQRKINIKKSRQ